MSQWERLLRSVVDTFSVHGDAVYTSEFGDDRRCWSVQRGEYRGDDGIPVVRRLWTEKTVSTNLLFSVPVQGVYPMWDHLSKVGVCVRVMN